MQQSHFMRRPLLLLAFVVTVGGFVACATAEEKPVEVVTPAEVAPVTVDTVMPMVDDTTREVANPKPPPAGQ